jgi:hypothetical protein
VSHRETNRIVVASRHLVDKGQSFPPDFQIGRNHSSDFRFCPVTQKISRLISPYAPVFYFFVFFFLVSASQIFFSLERRYLLFIALYVIECYLGCDFNSTPRVDKVLEETVVNVLPINDVINY